MSAVKSAIFPSSTTSWAASPVGDIQKKRAVGQGFVNQTIVARLDVVDMFARTLLQAIMHAAVGAARIGSTAAQIVLYPVWSTAAPLVELGEVSNHFSTAAKSLTAAAIVTMPALVVPDLAVSSYKWLGLYAAPKTRLQQIGDVAKKAWESPYRNRVLVGVACTVALAVGLKYLHSYMNPVSTEVRAAREVANESGAKAQEANQAAADADRKAAEAAAKAELDAKEATRQRLEYEATQAKMKEMNNDKYSATKDAEAKARASAAAAEQAKRDAAAQQAEAKRQAALAEAQRKAAEQAGKPLPRRLADWPLAAAGVDKLADGWRFARGYTTFIVGKDAMSQNIALPTLLALGGALGWGAIKLISGSCRSLNKCLQERAAARHSAAEEAEEAAQEAADRKAAKEKVLEDEFAPDLDAEHAKNSGKPAVPARPNRSKSKRVSTTASPSPRTATGPGNRNPLIDETTESTPPPEKQAAAPSASASAAQPAASPKKESPKVEEGSGDDEPTPATASGSKKSRKKSKRNKASAGKQPAPTSSSSSAAASKPADGSDVRDTPANQDAAKPHHRNGLQRLFGWNKDPKVVAAEAAKKSKKASEADTV